MDIPQGYKQTELGVIPDDWEVCSINQLVANNIIEKPLDGNHGNIHPKAKDYVSYGIPFIMANNIHNGILDLNNCQFIRKEQADNLQKGFSFAGDVLLTHKGTVGNVTIVDNILTPYIILTPQVTYYRVKDSNKITNLFIRYFFESRKFQVILRNLSGGGTRSYIGITKQKELPFVLPPLPEQKAIAQSLSDVDALITAIDKLITKKRNIKQGAMQELLTGKKRLPGFTGDRDVKKLGEASQGYKQSELGVIPDDWDVKKLGEVAPLQRGFDLPTPQLIKGNYPVVYSNGILNYHNRYQAKSPGVVTGRSGTIGKVTFVKTDYWPHNTTLWVTDFNGNYPKFIYYLYIFIRLVRFSTGSGVPTLNRNDVHAFKIPLPPPPEQKAIAQILSDMDAEIESLEKTREKYKLIKRGIMQELLTGKTRLKHQLDP